MGRITSNIGLVTGIPITDTVDQLMQISAIPRDRLQTRTDDLQSQQVAIQTLTSRLLSLQFDLGNLKSSTLYTSKKASSSDTTALTASIASGGEPLAGTYQFTPIRTASAQQLVSQRFPSKEDAFSAESFSFRTGGFVNQGIALDELNGGLGVRLGQIRITDKNGDSAVIDLRYALSVDDVLDAINNNAEINVSAAVVGDTFQLTDNTGQSGTLTVQEVNNSHTATDLGIVGINLSGGDTVGVGSDVFTLHAGTRLSLLNDGNGVRITDDATNDEDLVITLLDGTTADVDLSGAATIGDVLDAINDHEDLTGKITAAISSDGNRLELTDNSVDSGGTFSVSNGLLGTAADDLGLSVAAVGTDITGERLIAGLADTLISSLNGGQGIDTLGTLDITNRDGVLSPIDLSSAETLGDIVAAIDAGATDVTAAVNSDGSGIVVTDTTGGSASNLIVADNGGSTVAADLGIAIDSAATSINSGSLNRQTLSEATQLSAIRGGLGVTTIGDIQITDTNSVVTAIDLNTVGQQPETIGDVIDAINASGAQVEARLNDTGDGILILDTAGGAGSITIKDVSGTLAANLGLAGTSVEVDVEGTPTQVIDGTSITTVTIEESDTLEDIVETINGLDNGVVASIIYDGQGYRLSLAAEDSGAANKLLLGLQNSVFQFQQTSAAQDAILQYGNATSGGILLTSRNNSFNQVISGLNLNVQAASTSPVTVTVTENDASFLSAVDDFVAAYNSLRDALDEATSFDETDLSTGLLFGTTEALRVESDISRALTDRYFGLGTYQSLEQLGISVTDKGQLEVDTEKLKAAFADDPEGLENFFAEDSLGVVAKFDAVIDRLAGSDNGTLPNRYDTLQDTIEANQDRIDQYNEFLDRERERLLLQFYQLEQVIAQLQQSQSALDGLQPLEPLAIQRNR